MNPEFEDDSIRRWQEPRAESGRLRDDPAVLNIDIKTEEIFESRGYGLGSTAQEHLVAAAADIGLPLEVALEFGQEMSFKFIAKQRRADGLVTYVLVFAGLGERHLLERRDWVTEDEYRQAVAEFEEDVLANALVEAPLIVTLEEWRAYERGQGAANEKP
jgi:hypothetical protein